MSFDLFQTEEEAAENWAESAESTLSLFMQMDESVVQHYKDIWQIHLLCTVFAGGSWQTEGQPQDTAPPPMSPPKKTFFFFCIISVTHGLSRIPSQI